MFYRRKFYIVQSHFVEIFNAHFNNTNLPNQLKHGARLVGRWTKANNNDTTEIFAIWEYDSYEDYQRIEADVRSDEAHKKRIQDWYEKNGGREHVYKEYILEVRNEPLESTVQYTDKWACGRSDYVLDTEKLRSWGLVNVYSHKPHGYECPFCHVVSGVDVPNKGTKQGDIIYKNEKVTAFIASKWWPNNKGHVLVVPNEHFENMFELPVEYAAEIHHAAQLTAFAMKNTYECDGVSTRQHNEPGGGQDVWHYHLHVYPRYKSDQFYSTKGYQTDPEERSFYAEKLRGWIQEHV